jgi:hypothetical protein
MLTIANCKSKLKKTFQMSQGGRRQALARLMCEPPKRYVVGRERVLGLIIKL